MQCINSAMVEDFVEGDWQAGDWQADDKGNGYFNLGFVEDLVDDHGAAFLGFRFLLGQAGEGNLGVPSTQVYGWAKLWNGLDGCPPAEISEAEKRILDGNDSGNLGAGLNGRFGLLFNPSDR
ncbi:hypothetical protein IFR05_002713 [Cadophora sp. M221]|nr:hypothetical protein IFR05_002713 [Cadophora sp. M221]